MLLSRSAGPAAWCGLQNRLAEPLGSWPNCPSAPMTLLGFFSVAHGWLPLGESGPTTRRREHLLPFEVSGVDFQRTSAGTQGIVAAVNQADRLYTASLGRQRRPSAPFCRIRIALPWDSHASPWRFFHSLATVGGVSCTRCPRRSSPPDLRRLFPGRKVSHEPGNRQPLARPAYQFRQWAQWFWAGGAAERREINALDAIIVGQH
jgi:hypothetical protein